MKTIRRIQLLSPIVVAMITCLQVGLIFPPSAHAEKMSDATQDLVVNKLSRVLDTMDHKDPSWLPSQQRLADILAERARTRFMREIEANCENCKGSKDDRQRAIKIYEMLITELPLNEHGPLLFQLGHLYEIAGEESKAISLFEQIIRDAKTKSIAAEIVSRSHAELGDLFFKKGKFKEAYDHYVAALTDKTLENRTLVIYNMAWCEFNSEKLDSAISIFENLLKDPNKITKDTDEGSRYDEVIHTDIVRDLGSFYARREITKKDIYSYENFAPKSQRKDLMMSFAIEADRVAQKQAAHDILNRYLELPDLTKTERLEAFVRLAQVNYDRGEVSESTQDFAKAASEFKKSGCNEKLKCDDIQKTMKRYVTEVHRSKKLAPDADLLSAYVTYAKTFPQDKEMIQRGSQVAVDLKNYVVAIELYRGISGNSDFSKAERNEALLNEVAVAEKSEDVKLQVKSYEHFLKNATKDQKYYEVRYQHAYLLYTSKDLKKAVSELNDLAQDKSGSADLRKKSADLALDSLAQMKDDEKLRELAWEYADLFPAHRNEFLGIGRKALMNQVASVANNPKSTTSQLKSVMKSVLKTSLEGANSSERQLIFSNLSIIAKKLNDNDVYVKAMYSLVNIQDLNEGQRQQYIEQFVGHFEKKLDFKNAYKVALLLDGKKTTAKELEFRLGTLADLAEDKQLDPTIHYKKALASGLDGSRALVVRSRLVLLSNNSAKELKSQLHELNQKPKVLNETALLVYAKAPNDKELKSVLNQKELQNGTAARFAEKQEFYSSLEEFKANIAGAKIDQGNDKALQKSIQQRMKMLEKADEKLTKALSYKDITAELYSLNIIAEENHRLVKDLAHLDMPKGLSAEEKRQYVEALKKQSKPYLTKAKFTERRIQEIWNTSKGLSDLAKEYKIARPEIQSLLDRELDILKKIPGRGSMKNVIEQARSTSKVSQSELKSARKSVSENPSSAKDIEKLKLIESKIGHPLMTAYLDARLTHLKEEKVYEK